MSADRESSRRDFLQGRAAIDRLQALAESAVATPTAAVDTPTPTTAAAVPAPFLVHVNRRAMACLFELYFNGRQYPNDTEAGLLALDCVDRLEAQLSVYRETSELSHVNRAAATAAVPVEAGLFALLAQALELHTATDGAYDITASPLSRAWGYFRRAGAKPSEDELAAARERVGSQFVRLDAERQTVEFLRPGIELSLNSIGKGYALDRARELLEAEGVFDFLFHGGQSSVLAVGSQAGLSEGRTGWAVGLRHPLWPERRLAEFYLHDEALGTSGSATQFFHHQGKRYGHLLDPRTGQPADGVYSATVIAPTAAEADALATAFYVMGSAAAMSYCQQRPTLAAALVVPGERSGTIEIFAAGLDERRWTLLEPADLRESAGQTLDNRKT